MVDAVLIFFLGVGVSILAVAAISAAAFHLFRDRYEQSCQLRIYYDWVMRKGTQEQMRLAQELKQSKKLDQLKKMVGDGILVDP